MQSALKTDLGLVLATAVCAGISAASTFLEGRRAKRRGEDRQFFLQFVTSYMSPVLQDEIEPGLTWAEWLYTDVRCGLAHNFTIESGGVEYEAGSYTEIKSYGPEIRPPDLLEDFAQGWFRYLDEVRTSGSSKDLGTRFRKRFDEIFND